MKMRHGNVMAQICLRRDATVDKKISIIMLALIASLVLKTNVISTSVKCALDGFCTLRRIIWTKVYLLTKKSD